MKKNSRRYYAFIFCLNAYSCKAVIEYIGKKYPVAYHALHNPSSWGAHVHILIKFDKPQLLEPILSDIVSNTGFDVGMLHCSPVLNNQSYDLILAYLKKGEQNAE